MVAASEMRLPQVVIMKNKNMGPLRFELRTSAMSRRRHNQLDHEPGNMMLYSICHLIIKK
jgi:hypothetical protein